MVVEQGYMRGIPDTAEQTAYGMVRLRHRRAVAMARCCHTRCRTASRACRFGLIRILTGVDALGSGGRGYDVVYTRSIYYNVRLLLRKLGYCGSTSIMATSAVQVTHWD